MNQNESTEPEDDVYLSNQNLVDIEVDLPISVIVFLFQELCRRDIRPSEFWSELLNKYIEKANPTNE